MTKEEELQNSLSKTIDYYENYISELNHQSVMVYAAARNYEDKCKLLHDQLALTEKALELACDTAQFEDTCDYCAYKGELEITKDCPRWCETDEKFFATQAMGYFKEQAKEMMKSE